MSGLVDRFRCTETISGDRGYVGVVMGEAARVVGGEDVSQLPYVMKIVSWPGE